MGAHDAADSMSVAALFHLGPMWRADGAPPSARAGEQSADLGDHRRGSGAEASAGDCALRTSGGAARVRAVVWTGRTPGPTLSQSCGIREAARCRITHGSWTGDLRLSAHVSARMHCLPTPAGASSQRGAGGGGGGGMMQAMVSLGAEGYEKGPRSMYKVGKRGPGEGVVGSLSNAMLPARLRERRSRPPEEKEKSAMPRGETLCLFVWFGLI